MWAAPHSHQATRPLQSKSLVGDHCGLATDCRKQAAIAVDECGYGALATYTCFDDFCDVRTLLLRDRCNPGNRHAACVANLGRVANDEYVVVTGRPEVRPDRHAARAIAGYPEPACSRRCLDARRPDNRAHLDEFVPQCDAILAATGDRLPQAHFDAKARQCTHCVAR